MKAWGRQLPGVILATCIAGGPPAVASKVVESSTGVVLAVHGGTGIEKAKLGPKLEKEIRADLEMALRAGWTLLVEKKRSSLDAVEAAVRVLEDSPHFNAGKGAVFTHDGKNELDASIMEGATRRAGAVAGVATVKNPISAARAVMEKSPHVFLVSKGAEEFAKSQGLEIVAPTYFHTERRWKELQEKLEMEKLAKEKGAGKSAGLATDRGSEWSTVGAVAVDESKNVAAATSTGGMTNKRWGRVGDSPVIGAGTYADNEGCAVSATGHGEYFIRAAVAYDIVARRKYQGKTVAHAARGTIHESMARLGGEGGVIVLDREGNFASAFNSEGLYRGTITRDGKVRVALYEQ